MSEFEKRGVATVSITAEAYVRVARHSAQSFGLPDLPLAVVRAPFSNQSPEAIRALVDECIDQVIAGLTEERKNDTPTSRAHEIPVPDEEWLTFQGDDLLDGQKMMNDDFLAHGWSDGFPLCPPTGREMERMLCGTSRTARDTVAILEPGFGIATVEKIAANAVMAGCRPEHLPVVIAAVEALAEPKMYLRNKAMSTGPHAPLLVVNGPIKKKIGLNAGVCALGPGAPSFANTVIGRALRLCMMNLGHVYPGILDLDTIGSPTKYSLCVAENEEASPWPPYHVERGYDAHASTVTVQFVYGICELQNEQNLAPSALTEVFATAATNVAQFSTGLWLTGRRADARYGTEEQEHHCLLICPEHAQIFGRAGWSKNDIRQALHEKARLPFHMLMMTKEPKAVAAAHPELSWLWNSPDTLLPVVEEAKCYEIVVVGGAGGRGAFFWGAGEPVTKLIRD